MLKVPAISLLAFLAVSAMADVSLEEKKNRVEYLEGLSRNVVSMNIEAYKRELEYEKQNLPLEKRAENEANLLAEKIKVQIQKSYEAALAESGPEDAFEEVKSSIDKDLELVSPDLQEEIGTIAYAALESVSQSGAVNVNSDLTRMEEVLLKGVKERSDFLNRENSNNLRNAIITKTNAVVPVANGAKDAERKQYSDKAQLLESLTSDRDSARWVSTSNMSIRGDVISRADARISIRMKVDFMGVSLEAGPAISFSRTYQTAVSVMTEGLEPMLHSDGNFDFFKRDRDGKELVAGGKKVKRFMFFTCEASLDFDSDYNGGGNFSFAGVGGGMSVSKNYSNTVYLSSRRVVVPEELEGKTVTLKVLNQLCHNDFLKAKVTNTLDVAGSLNIMMKNVLAGVRFTHPKTKCLTDNHCEKWFTTEVLSLYRNNNVARCVEDQRDKFLTCELRGLKGQSCPVVDSKGKRLSSGVGEYACDAGLKCVTVQPAGLLSGAKGKCM